MPKAERRRTRARAAATAAVALGVWAASPVISARFDIQKEDEAYRAAAAQLAGELSAGAADWREVEPTGESRSWVRKASFGLDKRDEAGPFGLQAVSVRARDDQALTSLSTFASRNLGLAEVEKAELNCLAEAVYYEARSEDARGQLAVAEVVMNRVADSRFPKTICDVVFQGQYRQTGCQFTFTCDGSRRIKPQGPAWDRARAVAMHVQMGLNKPITNKATHYHTDYVNPYWSAGMIATKTVGTHIFYRFPKGGAEWSRVRLALSAQAAHQAAAAAVPSEAIAINDATVAAPTQPGDAIISPTSVSVTTQAAGDAVMVAGKF